VYPCFGTIVFLLRRFLSFFKYVTDTCDRISVTTMRNLIGRVGSSSGCELNNHRILTLRTIVGTYSAEALGAASGCRLNIGGGEPQDPVVCRNVPGPLAETSRIARVFYVAAFKFATLSHCWARYSSVASLGPPFAGSTDPPLHWEFQCLNNSRAVPPFFLFSSSSALTSNLVKIDQLLTTHRLP
jgi:hypothetical protein